MDGEHSNLGKVSKILVFWVWLVNPSTGTGIETPVGRLKSEALQISYTC